MALDPEVFKNMSASQIFTALVIEHESEKIKHARSIGARCVQCLDTGMSNGKFCDCKSGRDISHQSFNRK